jgi:hypothetical protein
MNKEKEKRNKSEIGNLYTIYIYLYIYILYSYIYITYILIYS